MPSRRTHADPTHLLAMKVYTALSWKKWKAIRKMNNQYVYRNQIQQAAKTLLHTPSIAMRHNQGAYVPVKKLLKDLLQEYIEADALYPHPNKPTSTISIKIVIDGTLMFKGKVEGFYLSLLDVAKLQSARHYQAVALSKSIEDNFALESVAHETNLLALPDACDRWTVNIRDTIYNLDYFITLDWIGLVSELGMKNPKYAQDTEVGCPFCGVLMGELRHTWWRTLFKLHSHTTDISAFPKAIFHQSPLNRRRYCMMHAININLTNSLADCYNLLPRNSPLRTELVQIIKQVCGKYKIGKTLEPVQSKAFFKREIYKEVIELFSRYRVSYTIPWPGQPRKLVVTAEHVMGLLFDSQRVYYNFAYTEWPTQTDFNTLNSARIGLLAVYAGMQWRMKPTMHFSTNEAIEFAKLDGTMYHTLNEGAEHHHHTLKELARNSMQNISIAQTTTSSFQQVLNDGTLMRILRQKGHAPFSYMLEPNTPNNQPPQQPNIPYLQYTPANL